LKINFAKNPPDKNLFFDLFQTTGWNKNYQLDADELYIAIKESWYMVSAYDNKRLVGFGRIICDGIVHAFILDMIVHPTYKRRGIGTKILNHLVGKCQSHNIRDIQLFCAKNKVDFYIKNGFTPRSNNSPGMELKKNMEALNEQNRRNCTKKKDGT
jgi:ribosomal protein S18 acetylase RimI-like enzyme